MPPPCCSPSVGIDAVSIDTVADAADRTSGAVYAHFGGKDGLLIALLDELVNDMAAVMEAELTVGDDVDEQLAGAVADLRRSAARTGSGLDAARARVLALRGPPRRSPRRTWPAASPRPASGSAT